MKKTVSMILVLALICCFVPSALAVGTGVQDATAYAQTAAEKLNSLGLFSGTGTDAAGNPEFDLGSVPTRAEAMTMLVGLLGKTDAAQAGSWTTPFTDVPTWAEKYVGYAYASGLTSGIDATTFGSDLKASAPEYLSFVLSALGYKPGTDFSLDNAVVLADQLGLTDGGKDLSSITDFLRGDVASISLSALSQNFKGTDVQLSQIIALAKELSAKSSVDIPVDQIAAIAQSVITEKGKLSSDDISAIAKLVAAEYDTGLPVEDIAGIASTLIESKGSNIPTDQIASVASSIAGKYGVNIPADQISGIAQLVQGLIKK